MALSNLVNEVLDDKYRIEKQLGQGGMGAVYLATHVGTERPVAVKVIAPEFMKHDEFVERFKREARAAGRLRHPNVVDVTDFGFARVDASRVAYLVMEYLDGCTLADVLEEEKRLPLDWVVDIMEQVCSALDEAHRQGIVHRDLKPDNIWLEPNRLGGYRIKVLDFGIAKLAEPGSVAGAEGDRDGGEGAVETNAGRHPAPPAAATGLKAMATHAASGSPTEIQLPASGEDAGTLLLPGGAPLNRDSSRASESEEAGTKILGPQAVDAALPGEGDATRIFDPPAMATPKLERAAATAHAGGVTRVGTILGTPLYMSPEQCRSQQLDSRADIYSLGVITYQMLAGATPFAGDLTSLIRQHVEAPPPSVRQKNRKVPKKLAATIDSALAKDRERRPPTAAAFASKLRASSEGLGALLRRAFALYSERFPLFLRISLLAHIPVIVLISLQFLIDGLQAAHILGGVAVICSQVIVAVVLFAANFLAASVISGMSIVIVVRLSLAPLRPVQLGAVFHAFRRRFRPFIVTAFMVTIMFIVGLVLCFIPGIVMMVRYAMYAPVVMMEGLQKRAALRRAKELMRRSRGTVYAVVLISFLIPIVSAAVAGRLAGGFVTETGVSTHGTNVHIKSESAARLSGLLNIFTIPLLSIITALVYLKLRQLGGEVTSLALDAFDDEEAPRSRWQSRMRARLTMAATSARRSLDG